MRVTHFTVDSTLQQTQDIISLKDEDKDLLNGNCQAGRLVESVP